MKVTQSRILRPLVFLHVNDLLKVLELECVISYADDVVVGASDKT